MKITDKNEIKIAVYKWVKIIQAMLLIVLGLALILISMIRIKNNQDTDLKSISYSIGIAFATYGLVNVLSGYLLEHSPVSKEVITGIAFASLGVAFIVKTEIIDTLFPLLIITCAYGFALILVVYGIEKIIGKEVKKNILISVLIFIGAAALISLATLYIFYYSNKSVTNYVLTGLGLLFAVLGIAAIAILLVKIHNTKQMQKEQEIKKMQEDIIIKDNETKTTKIIDISELRKQNGSNKKITNKETAQRITAGEDENSNEDTDIKADNVEITTEEDKNENVIPPSDESVETEAPKKKSRKQK